MAADASTPLMRQYNSVKEQVSGALLLFRLGDFYELFFEDAIVAARRVRFRVIGESPILSFVIIIM